MSDIYPADDLLLANNSMGAHLRDTLLALPDSKWEQEDYLALLQQLDDEGLDDFTRVRELLGIATGKDNGWFTLRVGELKAMLALAGGDLDQALSWTEWTQDFNDSVFTAQRSNYYRCLQTLLLLAQEPERDPQNITTPLPKCTAVKRSMPPAPPLLAKPASTACLPWMTPLPLYLHTSRCWLPMRSCNRLNVVTGRQNNGRLMQPACVLY